MVTGTKHPTVHAREINGQRREVRQTATARIYSRPKLFAELDWLLMEGPEHDNADDLRDLANRIGHEY
jgi:hypothetical protein